MNPVRQGDGVGLSAAGFSEVREGDGTVLWSQGGAIPDSAIAQYDARALTGYSDGDPVNTWPDEGGNYDVTGTAPTFRSSGINGNPSVEFDGSDDVLSATFNSTESQPNTIAAVVEPFNADQTGYTAVVDAESNLHQLAYNTGGNNNNIELIVNDSSITQLGGGSITNDPFLIVGIFDGNDSEIRANGSSVATGSLDDSVGLDGIQLGHGNNGPEEHLSGYLGEVVPYEADLRATGTLPTEEQRLADKWGIFD